MTARSRRLGVWTVWVLFLVAVSPASPARAQEAHRIPRLQRNRGAVQLMVDGAPFLVLRGGLHNSGASSLDYMTEIWPKLQRMNLNIVLAVVSWAEVELREGTFDFTVVDGLLQEARRRDLRLAFPQARG